MKIVKNSKIGLKGIIIMEKTEVENLMLLSL
jgi:hypothetical protein